MSHVRVAIFALALISANFFGVASATSSESPAAASLEAPLLFGTFGMQVSATAFPSFASYNNYSFAGHTLYKVYFTTENADDQVVSVFGDEGYLLSIQAPSGLYNSYFASGPTATETGGDASPYDSNVTIDLSSGPVLPDSDNENILLSGAGSSSLAMWFHATNGLSAAVDISVDSAAEQVAWGVSSDAANSVAGLDRKVLVMQANSPGVVSGRLNAVVYPHGVEANAVIVSAEFVGSVVSGVEIWGCSDPAACNYVDSVTDDNGSCIYPASGEVDCGGACLSDVDGDGVCDGDEVAGCSDDAACNYNAEATDEAACTYPTSWYLDADGDGIGVADEAVLACTAPSGYVATAGDGCPEDVAKLAPGSCGCGQVDDDADEDGLADCSDDCVDIEACNYAALPTESCTYALEHYDCDGACLADADGDGVCDALEVLGCTDSGACNYTAGATEDDASCTYPDMPYLDCGGECLNDLDADGVCDELEVAGCTVVLACNYDETATDDDGSCTYCDCAPTQGLSPYSLTVEVHATDGLEGQTTYRLYINTFAERDMVNALFSDAAHPFVLTSSASPNWYQTPAPFGVDFGVSYNESWLSLAPDLAYDSWFTIGADNAVEAAGLPIAVISATPATSPLVPFNAGTALSYVNDPSGFSIYTTGTCNRLAAPSDPSWCPSDYPPFGGADRRVLIAQITTAGELSGTLSVSVLPEGIASGSYLPKVFEFEGIGTFSSTDWDGESASVYQSCGCTEVGSINYDPAALYSDGSCIQPVSGCTDDAACNFDEEANVEDGSCSYGSVWYADADGDGFGNPDDSTSSCDQPAGYVSTAGDGCPSDAAKQAPGDCGCGIPDVDVDTDGLADCLDGCTDSAACNFSDPAAVECEFPAAYYDCEGECVSDADADGVCDELEVEGCTDDLACNYDESATEEDGTCTHAASGYDCAGDCLVDTDGDGVCDAFEVLGCDDESACNYEMGASEDDGSCEYASAGYNCAGTCLADADLDGVCDEFEVPGCQTPTACNYNEDATDADGTCTFAATGYDCDGVCLNDADGDGTCDEFEVAGCQDHAACNYNAAASESDGSCTYAATGYTCDGNCVNDADGDGVCDEFEIAGCDDEAACNFEVGATDNDGSCTYPATGYGCNGECLNDADGDGTCDEFEVAGCQDHLACNYNSAATDSDGSCTYATTGYDCNGLCLNDVDSDGVCDEFEQLGCDDDSACNFDESATENDGSCVYPDLAYDCDGNCLNDLNANDICDELEVAGCMEQGAYNYNPGANVAGEECVYGGCTNHFACNFDPNTDLDDGSCELPVPGYDCDGACVLDVDGDGVCDGLEVYGCMDESACNYDDAATENFCCDYGDGVRDCAGVCLNDADGDGVCDSEEVWGCTDALAWNYQPAATEDDGFCIDVNPEDLYDEAYLAGQTNGAIIGFNSGYDVGYDAGLSAGAADCDGQVFCGEGTEWHPELEVCLPLAACLGDLDGNAVRGTNDLLLLLSVFGDECE